MVRQATLNDKKGILEIANELRLNIPNFIWNTDAFIAEQIINGEYFTLEDGDQMVGIVSLRHTAKKIHIETLAVKKRFAGRGYGTKLVEFAKQFAKGKGFSKLYSYSFHQYRIKDFYLKKGFMLLDQEGDYRGNKYYCFEAKLS